MMEVKMKSKIVTDQKNKTFKNKIKLSGAGAIIQWGEPLPCTLTT